MKARSFLTLLTSSLLAITSQLNAQTNQTVSFRFDEMPLDKAAQVLLGEVIKTPYVLAADLKTKSEPITLDIVGVTTSQASSIFAQYLSVKGYDYQSREGVVWILPKSESTEPISIWSYTPKNRKASYLIDLLGPLFPDSITQRKSGLSQGNLNTTEAPNSVASLSKDNHDVLIFRGTEAEQQSFNQAIERVDTPVRQADLRALIVEIQNDELVVNSFQAILNAFNSNIGFTLGSPGQGIANANVSIKGLDILASMLSVDSRFKLVSKPHLRVISGHSSMFQVGTETPVISSDSLDSEGRPFRTVDYKPSGIIFEVTPTIFDSHLTVDVAQIISDFVQTNTGVTDSPTLIKREVRSTVSMKHGEVVVLGSLAEDKNTNATSGFSFIRLGSSTENSNRSLILVLQAQIL